MKQGCFVVVGYNNIRIYDVQKLRDLCNKDFNAKLVLITEVLNEDDKSFCDINIVVSMEKTEYLQALDTIIGELESQSLQPIGILPFSDRGSILGAHLSQAFRLPGASLAEAEFGLDKRKLRVLEHDAKKHPEGYQVIQCLPIDSLEALKESLRQLGGQGFLKPAQGGNSRGCQVIYHESQCEEIWQSLKPWHNSGIILETLIEQAKEYSWDSVAGGQWITEKFTTEGNYRAEYQQIVPARLTHDQRATLSQAGKHVSSLISDFNGAWHNEFFLLRNGAAAVECNMRPAGMYIWDLAQISFKDFNPWKAWLQWAVDGKTIEAELIPEKYAGVRMVSATQSGRIIELPDIFDVGNRIGVAVHQWAWYLKPGDEVTNEIKTNGDYLGYFILSAKDGDSLESKLASFSKTIEEVIKIQKP